MEMVFLEQQETSQDSRLKYLKNSLIIFLICVSCHSKNDEIEIESSLNEIKTPAIEKNRKDVNFKLRNGVLHYKKVAYSGVVKEFYDNGALQSESDYFQGKRQGSFLGWYRNGNQWFERFYTKGFKSGIHRGWFQNGQKMFHYQFNTQGLYDGFVKDWHANGILEKHFNFVEGKETGSQKMWNLKGDIKANFYTVNGERHGLIGLKKCVSVVAKTVKND